MRYFFLAICSLLLFTSCEEVLDVEGLPYEDKLVIHGFLYADSTNTLIRITRTLPLDAPYDTTQGFIRDAVGSITSNGEIYPLEYVGHGGIYRPVGLIPQVGKSYHLTLDWQGRHATATTMIPRAGTVDSVWYTLNEIEYGYRIVYSIRMRGEQGTSIESEVNAQGRYVSGGSFYYGGSRELVRVKSSDEPVTTVGNFYFGYYETAIIDSAVVDLYSYAPDYFEYAESRNGEGDIVSGSPAPVRWNVKGDAIGVFFGANKSRYVYRP
jgi:hypothetical protein